METHNRNDVEGRARLTDLDEGNLSGMAIHCFLWAFLGFLANVHRLEIYRMLIGSIKKMSLSNRIPYMTR